MKRKNNRRFYFLVSVLMLHSVFTFGLDATITSALGYNRTRTFTTDKEGAIVAVIQNQNSLNNAVLLSQDLFGGWNLGGGLTAVNSINNTLNYGLAMTPQQINYQGTVTYTNLNDLSFSLQYNLNTTINLGAVIGNYRTVTTPWDSEPLLNVAYNFPFNNGWFDCSAAVSAGYDFGILTNQDGWEFNLSLQPAINFTNNSVSVVIPLVLSFDTRGFKGFPETGFSSFAAGFDITWIIADFVVLEGQAGYSFSISGKEAYDRNNSSPYLSVSAGFQLSSDSADTADSSDTNSESIDNNGLKNSTQGPGTN